MPDNGTSRTPSPTNNFLAYYKFYMYHLARLRRGQVSPPYLFFEVSHKSNKQNLPLIDFNLSTAHFPIPRNLISSEQRYALRSTNIIIYSFFFIHYNSSTFPPAAHPRWPFLFLNKQSAYKPLDKYG